MTTPEAGSDRKQRSGKDFNFMSGSFLVLGAVFFDAVIAFFVARKAVKGEGQGSLIGRNLRCMIRVGRPLEN